MSRVIDILKVALVATMFLTILYSSYIMSGNLAVPFTKDYYAFPEVKANADPWYDRVVKQGEFQATGWINENTNKSDKFVADIFGAELIMGMTTRVSTVGGDWANAPNPVKLMGDTNTIYISNDAKTAHDMAIGNNASYIFLPNRYTFSGYGWELPDYEKFTDTEYFQVVYENPDVTIIKVLP